MPESEQIDSLQAREKILATASRLFSEQGYENTSLAQVARQAKVSKALIFWHFDSKEKLYRSALRKTLEPYFIDVDGLEGLGEREQIERLIDLFYDFVHENVDSVRFFLNLTLQVDRQQDEVLGRVQELYRVFRKSLAEIFESGRRHGVFRDGTQPEREAGLIMAALAGLLIQHFRSDGSPDDARDLIEHLKTTLFQRLLVPAVGSTPAGRP
ncbi:MAG: TetR/AcrR family transcriptional regulator [Deltaproteobacteria bacterium]|jgi:AcrR family transcriptional regulator|nr:TetR/AcrR family transcriptional regulator [Deltaproteobacteria bacterium]